MAQVIVQPQGSESGVECIGVDELKGVGMARSRLLRTWSQLAITRALKSGDGSWLRHWKRRIDRQLLSSSISTP